MLKHKVEANYIVTFNDPCDMHEFNFLQTMLFRYVKSTREPIQSFPLDIDDRKSEYFEIL